MVLATNADRNLQTGNFSGDQIKRSPRFLGLEQIQLLYLYDPKHISFAEAMAPGGPVEILKRLQEEGVIRHLGVAGWSARSLTLLAIRTRCTHHSPTRDMEGRLIFVGLFQGDVTFHDPDFHKRELTLLSSRNATAADFRQIIRALEAGQIDLDA